MSKSKGVGRAHITHSPDLSCYSPGKRPARFNPAVQVADQCTPTDAKPTRRHYNQATAGIGKLSHPK